MTTRKKVKLAIFVLICICLIVYALSWLPKKISLEYPYVEYHENDETHVVHGTIRIEGKIQRPFFRNPIFHGEIDVDNYEPIKNWDSGNEMLFPNLYESGYSELYLMYEELFYEYTRLFGRMCVYKNFDALKIYVEEYPRGNLKDAGYYGLMIAAPATTLEEAKEVANIYYFVPREPVEIK